MTKYRRKTANAKERDRMKLVNQAFDRLREVMPDLNLILDQEKETKVGPGPPMGCLFDVFVKHTILVRNCVVTVEKLAGCFHL